MLTPSHLLRLYPRLWQLKYGQEFQAMLESTPPTWRRTRDVVRAAAWEWLRWTNVGRLLLAFAIGAVATLCSVALTAAVPGGQFVARLRSLHGWTEFWISALLLLLPSIIATGVVAAARSHSTHPSRFGFRGQLAVLFVCAVYAGVLGTFEHLPLTASGFVKASLGNGFFIAYFLWLIFNIERAGTWRRRFSPEFLRTRSE